MWEIRHILEDELKAAITSGKPFDIMTANSDLQTNLDKLAREYDKVGLLVKHSVVQQTFYSISTPVQSFLHGGTLILS